jgi:hypothetical protein
MFHLASETFSMQKLEYAWVVTVSRLHQRLYSQWSINYRADKPTFEAVIAQIQVWLLRLDHVDNSILLTKLVTFYDKMNNNFICNSWLFNVFCRKTRESMIRKHERSHRMYLKLMMIDFVLNYIRPFAIHNVRKRGYNCKYVYIHYRNGYRWRTLLTFKKRDMHGGQITTNPKKYSGVQNNTPRCAVLALHHYMSHFLRKSVAWHFRNRCVRFAPDSRRLAVALFKHIFGGYYVPGLDNSSINH